MSYACDIVIPVRRWSPDATTRKSTAMKSALINIRLDLTLAPAPSGANASESVRAILADAIARKLSPLAWTPRRGAASQPLTFRLDAESDLAIRDMAHTLGLPLSRVVHGLLHAASQPVTLAVTQAKKPKGKVKAKRKAKAVK